MSHDRGRRAACGMTILILLFHAESPSKARGVTAMVVGSGALLDLFWIAKTGATEETGNPDKSCVIAKPILSSKRRLRRNLPEGREILFSARTQRDERTSTKPFFVQRQR